jgi:hypothetical protein
MPTYEVEWSATGTATVEADTQDEAEEVVSDAVYGQDTLMLERFDVDMVEIHECVTDDEEEEVEAR